MLVLSRYEGEKIKIGENVILTVISAQTRNGRLQIRLGIEAPRDVAIYRTEMLTETPHLRPIPMPYDEPAPPSGA